MHSMVVLLSLLTVLTGCGKEQPVDEPQGGQEEPSTQVQDGKVLVACFSFTGTTKTAATTLACLTEGTLYLIEPETPYGSENSNYYDESTRAYQEQYGPASVRPAIKKTLEEADGYDIVMLGFPIWYGKSPRVVFTFLDTYSFKGKTATGIPLRCCRSSGQALPRLQPLRDGRAIRVCGRPFHKWLSIETLFQTEHVCLMMQG